MVSDPSDEIAERLVRELQELGPLGAGGMAVEEIVGLARRRNQSLELLAGAYERFAAQAHEQNLLRAQDGIGEAARLAARARQDLETVLAEATDPLLAPLRQTVKTDILQADLLLDDVVCWRKERFAERVSAYYSNLYVPESEQARQRASGALSEAEDIVASWQQQGDLDAHVKAQLSQMQTEFARPRERRAVILLAEARQWLANAQDAAPGRSPGGPSFSQTAVGHKTDPFVALRCLGHAQALLQSVGDDARPASTPEMEELQRQINQARNQNLEKAGGWLRQDRHRAIEDLESDIGRRIGELGSSLEDALAAQTDQAHEIRQRLDELLVRRLAEPGYQIRNPEVQRWMQERTRNRYEAELLHQEANTLWSRAIRKRPLVYAVLTCLNMALTKDPDNQKVVDLKRTIEREEWTEMDQEVAQAVAKARERIKTADDVLANLLRPAEAGGGSPTPDYAEGSSTPSTSPPTMSEIEGAIQQASGILDQADEFREFVSHRLDEQATEPTPWKSEYVSLEYDMQQVRQHIKDLNEDVQFARRLLTLWREQKSDARPLIAVTKRALETGALPAAIAEALTQQLWDCPVPRSVQPRELGARPNSQAANRRKT